MLVPGDGSYSSLTTTAMGAAAIEGELTMLRAMQPGSSPTHAVATIDPTGYPLVIDLDLGNEPPFAPRMERSAGLTGFAPDPDALVEPLGGGLYHINAPASGLPAEFFRFPFKTFFCQPHQRLRPTNRHP